MKYAIVESGGKQYKAVEGQTIEVDRLFEDVGKKIQLKQVLLVSDGKKVDVGTPTIRGASVKATIVAQFKAPKVIVFKYKPRNRYRVKRGHRQMYTRLMINSIQTSKPKPAAKPKIEAAKPEAAKKPTPTKKPTSAKASTAKKETPAAKKTAAKKTKGPGTKKASETKKSAGSSKTKSSTKKE